MRMLVCIKQVPDTTEVKLGADYTLERDFVGAGDESGGRRARSSLRCSCRTSMVAR